MIRHILALISVVISLAVMYYLYTVDVEVDRLGRIAKIIEKSELQVKLENHQTVASGPTSQPLQKIDSSSTQVSNNKEAEDKLKALKEKAGNISAFEISALYKSKCSSCHGINGGGGIGPKLMGQKEDELRKKLADFKSGVKKNYVMYGLLQNLSEEDLNSLSLEISEFEKKLAEATK